MTDQLPAEAVQRLREAIGAQLAVYPTITQATTILSALPHLRPEPSRLVHVHGTEDGPGLSCREIRLADGSLLGSCQLPPAPTPGPEPSEDEREAALNVAYGEMRHRELPGSAQVFMEATFVADALLAAGFRHPSPATVEAVTAEAFPLDGSEPDTVFECRRRMVAVLARFAFPAPVAPAEPQLRAESVREALRYIGMVHRPGLVSLKQILVDLEEVAYRMSQGMTARGNTRPVGLPAPVTDAITDQSVTPTPVVTDEDRVGWYEWFKPGAKTTHIAYVHENGQVYDPEHGWNPEDFTLAAAEGNVHRLVRALTPEAGQ